MAVTEISIIHHVGIVLIVLWVLNSCGFCHPFAYFAALVYLYQVHERTSMRLRQKLRYEGRKAAYQRRILTDSESVRWLNHAVGKVWSICLEQIISQRIFLPIIPWFLDKYKPWTVKQAVVQQLYLGRSPPTFTYLRVLHESNDDDHLVLELGLNFLTADDMSAVLYAKLRRRLGFGIMAKMHLTGMHIEGKVLVGVKFLRSWPFLGRIRVCFAEPPYCQVTVKPIFNHGLDVTEVPGIAGWVDKLLSIAFEETLVEPNMLVVDMEKFVSPQSESWFSVVEKDPIAHVHVEVIEAAEFKSSDLIGLVDAYVKGQLGSYKFTTQVQKKTLTPKWQEEFRIPICSWESQNVLEIIVRDKDTFIDGELGNCSVNINDLRGGQRHDLWLPLEDVKMGRLHLAITVVDAERKANEDKDKENKVENKIPGSPMRKTAEERSIATTTPPTKSEKIADTFEPKKPEKIADKFEPVNFEGQKETGIWVHHPGTETCQAWEPRKGKGRQTDTEVIAGVDPTKLSTPFSVDATKQQQSPTLTSPKSDISSDDEGSKSARKTKFGQKIQMGFNKFLHKHSRKDDAWNSSGESGDSCSSPRPHVKVIHDTKTGADVIVNDGLAGTPREKLLKNTKNMLKNAGKSASSLKGVFSRKGSKLLDILEEALESDPSSPSSGEEDESVSSPVRSKSISRARSSKHKEDGEVVETDQTGQTTVVLNRNKSNKTKPVPRNPPYASEPEDDSIRKARLDKHKPNQAMPYPRTQSPP